MQNPHDWVRDETFELWNKYHPECKPKKEYRIKTGFGTRADLAVFVGPDSYPIGVEIVDSHAYEPFAAATKKLDKIVAKGETTTLEYAEKLLAFNDKFAEDLSQKILKCINEKGKTRSEYIEGFKDGYAIGCATILARIALVDPIILEVLGKKAQLYDWEKTQKDGSFNMVLQKTLCELKKQTKPKQTRWVAESNFCPKCGSKGTINWNRTVKIEESEKMVKEEGFDYCESCDYMSSIQVRDVWIVRDVRV